MVTVELIDCVLCGQETLFEQPPCADGHTEDGGECPEWVCTDCGSALLLGAEQSPRGRVWHDVA